jgi:hypothetical protein
MHIPLSRFPYPNTNGMRSFFVFLRVLRPPAVLTLYNYGVRAGVVNNHVGPRLTRSSQLSTLPSRQYSLHWRYLALLVVLSLSFPTWGVFVAFAVRVIYNLPLVRA